MAFQRKSSKHIAGALERAANLRGIDPALDLGSGLTLAGVKFGKDSSEYEMAGGTRASEINYHPGAPPETTPAGGGA